MIQTLELSNQQHKITIINTLRAPKEKSDTQKEMKDVKKEMRTAIE